MNQQKRAETLTSRRDSDNGKPAATSRAGPVPVQQAAAQETEREGVSWELLTRAAILMVGLVVTVVALSLGRSIIMPVLAATIIGITLRPIQTLAARYRIPYALSAFILVAVLFAAVYGAVSLVAGPLADWLPKAQEFGGQLREKFRWLDGPLAVLREVRTTMGQTGGGQTVTVETSLPALIQDAAQVVTPAVTEFLVFFGTLLFFLVGSDTLRRRLVTAFEKREARLRVLRIWNDVEQNLITYVGTVTGINLALGVITGIMVHLLGYPNAVTFGVLAFGLNYIPYIGPAIVIAILFGVGLLVAPSLGGAAIAPLIFVGLTTVEGHFITPSIVGRRLTLSPFLVFLALAFWAWLWGPLGAFLATPLLIVGLVVVGYLFPREEMELPK